METARVLKALPLLTKTLPKLRVKLWVHHYTTEPHAPPWVKKHFKIMFCESCMCIYDMQMLTSSSCNIINTLIHYQWKKFVGLHCFLQNFSALTSALQNTMNAPFLCVRERYSSLHYFLIYNFPCVTIALHSLHEITLKCINDWVVFL